MYILLYEKMSIYLCQKMYKQSYLLHKNYPFSFITILVIENPRDLSSYDYYCF